MSADNEPQVKLLRRGITLSAYDDADPMAKRNMFREVLDYATTASDAMRTLTDNRKPSGHFSEEKENPKDWPTYSVTSGGKLWKWNCGWQQYDKAGNKVGVPIGHSEFRRKPLAKQKDPWLKLSRPDGPWRRHIDAVLVHPLYGNGKVSWTDGMHAFFHFSSKHPETGVVTEHVKEVTFDSLNEIAVITAHNNRKSESLTPKEAKVRIAKLDSLYLDLL